MSLFKSFSIRTFIVLSLVSAYSTVTFSDEDEADDTVEEVIVTGSRIARAETDGASTCYCYYARRYKSNW